MFQFFINGCHAGLHLVSGTEIVGLHMMQDLQRTVYKSQQEAIEFYGLTV